MPLENLEIACNEADIFSLVDTKTSFKNLWIRLVHVIWDELVANL